ncbi:flap endonuclease 1-B [Capsaspora owczarzaki ATCC 30864]|uniref:Flap endonuclease 1 n=1 Tax=Capsaspora owczarzaki (strain ATCC 30864) TaxID=595528 RepID=A0A0D2VYG4_CAPO3|nr:flap endonuclease 1-B [Capsaspora owczarzaki ATCC 30864]KJE96762.1 flap endonuclease 1-B [Capsaspora owczarzaki ATCC 30864]|eukprot:XP_004343758.1 flap endonuclease 1-B [Capsaspora owczarzaki ATCC 30864]
MGIHNLAKLLADQAPHCVRENVIKAYFGRKVAIDASMSMYQFLIAVRSEGNQLMNDAGETTSHLVGFFYRTIRMLENGIKPVYVFDGKPPVMKSGELAKRTARREEAQASLDAATEAGESETMEKFQRRLVKVTKEHNEECKRLLTLMGVPYISAPCEAEAQCAALVKSGSVFAAGTEDMDALTFGSKVLLRHLTFSEARKMPIKEFNLDRALEGLKLTMEQFVDLCILLGCDYCESIKGIGPTRAYALIQEYKTIEEIIKNLDTEKYPLPANWAFAEARTLFLEPEVTPGEELDLKWTAPDVEGLVKFMVQEKGFSEDRIRNNAAKLVDLKSTATQGRLDNFFTVSGVVSSKRKSEEELAKEAKKGRMSVKSMVKGGSAASKSKKKY